MHRLLAAAVMALIASRAAAQAPPDHASRLRESFHPVLAQPGLGGLPLHARVSVAGNVVDGTVLAILAHRPEQVMALLDNVRGWCGFILLHPNVKACAGEPAAERQRMVLYAGTKHYQPVELSRPQRYDLRLERRESGVFALRLSPAPTPPADGAGFVLMEMVALEDGRTGLRAQFRQALGAGTRALAAGYFVTLGRDKVGFSAAGVDAEGKPVLVGGLTGAIERNVVRHFLAIETLLAARAGGGDMPLEGRLAHWFALAERHARQLHEMDRAEYLDIKLREFAQSDELQKSIDARAGD